VRSTRCPGATGARWLVAPSPANLAARLTHAQPDGIANVSVSIGGTSLAADIDPVGGWRAKFGLGKGTYTATATATLTSGHQIRVSRSFSVAAAGGGPVPGTVTPGTGAQRATVIHANRPAPHCSALPATVTGTVGKLRAGSLVITRRLNGAIVALQGRKSVGAPWVTLDRDKVQGGKYSLHWTRTADAGRTAGLRALCGKQQRGAEGSHSGLRGHPLPDPMVHDRPHDRLERGQGPVVRPRSQGGRCAGFLRVGEGAFVRTAARSRAGGQALPQPERKLGSPGAVTRRERGCAAARSPEN
jgi:hypothetical protein